MIRNPVRSDAANSESMAGAKCEPKTSAVVVPAPTRQVISSSATAWAYAASANRASSGNAQRSSQSSNGIPRPAMARTWG